MRILIIEDDAELCELIRFTLRQEGNVASTYASDDSLYAVPTRVSAWLLTGIDTEGIGSLDEFVSWLEEQPRQEIGMIPAPLMEMLYPLLAVNWFREDGTLDVEALAFDLTALERLAGITENAYTWDESLLGQSMYWAGEKFAAVFGRLGRLESVAHVYSAITIRGGGTVSLFPDDGCLIPSSILGVNATGDEVDAALDFVQFALSADSQQVAFDAGMPINRTALEAIANSEAPGAENGSISVTNETEERFELATYWPTAEQRAAHRG